ncbi:MAG: ATP-dependent DNA helicase [Planctomyces sp.]|nr:ATP-dependent DNA helicase [Planctomyces sp.]
MITAPDATAIPLPESGLARLQQQLNPEQLAAARFGDAPLLIIAGAGTGKTTTLVHRVAQLIASGIDPGEILLLTFTRRAAAEMIRRVDQLLSHVTKTPASMKFHGRKVVGGTFHAVATRHLREFGQYVGLDADFTILDRSDSEDLMNELRAEIDIAHKEKRFPLKGTCIDIYSRCVNTRQPLSTVLKETFPWCVEHEAGLKSLFQLFTQRKEDQRILDYDDLLLFWLALLADSPAAELLRQRYKAVLVDEYQDTNALQGEIVRALRPDGRGLTVVGDDAQSIYSFRAATIENILRFDQEFPNTQVLTLSQNYRSTPEILEASNLVMSLATEGRRKKLWTSRPPQGKPQLVNCRDDNEQSTLVADRILELRETGVSLKGQAVLFRASHHSATLEIELSRRNIPFVKFGGLKFVESAHVKDAMALLRLAENPRDSVSALRVLLLLPGIGPKTARQLTERLGTGAGAFEPWREHQPAAATQLHWPVFVALLRTLVKGGQTSVPLPLQLAQVRQFLAPLLEQKYDHAPARLRDLEQLEVVASRFESRSQFLTELTLDPPTSTQDFAQDPLLDEDWITLSTIHSAKGLEWDAVYVLHAADGNIPSDIATRNPREIEEERRLFYVALTRAKTHLHVYHPQRYYFHGRNQSDRHSYSQRTRFLPDDILSAWELVVPRSPGAMPSGPVENGLTTADVRKKIGRMWE